MVAVRTAGGDPTYDQVRTGDIADGAVTTAKLADGAVTTAKVADGTITTAKGYVAVVRIFSQPDRQSNLYPIGRCIGELQSMKGVRRLSRDEAIRRAKQLNDELHDVDLLPTREVGRDRKALKREYVEWRRSQFSVEMENNIAEQYVNEDKGW